MLLLRSTVVANKGTARQKIAKTIAQLISAGIPELYGNSLPVLKFWDEVQDFPFVSVTCANEQREYLPVGFEWGYCAVMIRLYVKSDDSPLDDTEAILEKIEAILRNNIVIEFDTGRCSVDIRINSIDTDGGLLAPHGVGEISAIVQYEVN